MPLKLTNRATTLLAGSISASATTLAVQASTGAKFPTLSPGDWFPLVVVAADGSYEIMRATARSGDVITVTREQEGTTAIPFAAGARVDLRLTEAAIADVIADLETAITTADNVVKATLRGELNAPSGTRAIFQQAAAPTGWTRDTTDNDTALRLTSGTVGSGGSVNFSTLHGRTATDAIALAQTNLPNVNFSVTIPEGQGSHSHTVTHNAATSAGSSNGVNSAPVVYLLSGATITVNAATLPAMTGTAASGGSGTAFSMPIDMRVKYRDVILAQKN